MSTEVDQLVSKLKDRTEDEAFRYSDRLAQIGDDYVLSTMIDLLYDDDADTKYLAARTLGKIKDNQSALEPLLRAIEDKRNEGVAGGMVEALTQFDISSKFVEIFKLYIFGNFKVSGIAKWMLDFSEFDITQRVIKKAKKHWQHFTFNSNHDEKYEEKKLEVEAIFNDFDEMFENDD